MKIFSSWAILTLVACTLNFSEQFDTVLLAIGGTKTVQPYDLAAFAATLNHNPGLYTPERGALLKDILQHPKNDLALHILQHVRFSLSDSKFASFCDEVMIRQHNRLFEAIFHKSDVCNFDADRFDLVSEDRLVDLVAKHCAAESALRWSLAHNFCERNGKNKARIKDFAPKDAQETCEYLLNSDQIHLAAQLLRLTVRYSPKIFEPTVNRLLATQFVPTTSNSIADVFRLFSAPRFDIIRGGHKFISDEDLLAILHEIMQVNVPMQDAVQTIAEIFAGRVSKNIHKSTALFKNPLMCVALDNAAPISIVATLEMLLKKKMYAVAWPFLGKIALSNNTRLTRNALALFSVDTEQKKMRAFLKKYSVARNPNALSEGMQITLVQHTVEARITAGLLVAGVSCFEQLKLSVNSSSNMNASLYLTDSLLVALQSESVDESTALHVVSSIIFAVDSANYLKLLALSIDRNQILLASKMFHESNQCKNEHFLKTANQSLLVNLSTLLCPLKSSLRTSLAENVFGHLKAAAPQILMSLLSESLSGMAQNQSQIDYAQSKLANLLPIFPSYVFGVVLQIAASQFKTDSEQIVNSLKKGEYTLLSHFGDILIESDNNSAFFSDLALYALYRSCFKANVEHLPAITQIIAEIFHARGLKRPTKLQMVNADILLQFCGKKSFGYDVTPNEKAQVVEFLNNCHQFAWVKAIGHSLNLLEQVDPLLDRTQVTEENVALVDGSKATKQLEQLIHVNLQPQTESKQGKAPFVRPISIMETKGTPENGSIFDDYSEDLFVPRYPDEEIEGLEATSHSQKMLEAVPEEDDPSSV